MNHCCFLIVRKQSIVGSSGNLRTGGETVKRVVLSRLMTGISEHHLITGINKSNNNNRHWCVQYFMRTSTANPPSSSLFCSVPFCSVLFCKQWALHTERDLTQDPTARKAQPSSLPPEPGPQPVSHYTFYKQAFYYMFNFASSYGTSRKCHL